MRAETIPTITNPILIPFIDFKVPAGFPSPALDYMEERIDLTKELVKHPLSTYIMKAEGDSMINAFIPHHTKLLVDRSITPQNGDIVVAVVNDGFTVKFLKKNERKAWLVPANSKYREMEITPEMEVTIWGVVIHIITDVNDIKKCMR